MNRNRKSHTQQIEELTKDPTKLHVDYMINGIFSAFGGNDSVVFNPNHNSILTIDVIREILEPAINMGYSLHLSPACLIIRQIERGTNSDNNIFNEWAKEFGI